VGEELARQLQEFSLIELVAVVAAIAYLVLAIRQSILCWFFALVSTAIYIGLFIDARLYMESFLNVFYFGMAAYGWYFWYFGGERQSGVPVTRWEWPVHAAALAAVLALSLVSGWLLDRHSDAAFPYADSMTTFGAFWATFLVARKVLENWWYWLVIDAVSVYLYWARELPLTALLFVGYLVLIPFGLVAWTRAYRERSPATA
jgi:nicotinamide mononucleotide transporter